eukprot:jgi/Hompol1/2757/HPOL_001451-RA
MTPVKPTKQQHSKQYKQHTMAGRRASADESRRQTSVSPVITAAASTPDSSQESRIRGKLAECEIVHDASAPRVPFSPPETQRTVTEQQQAASHLSTPSPSRCGRYEDSKSPSTVLVSRTQTSQEATKQSRYHPAYEARSEDADPDRSRVKAEEADSETSQNQNHECHDIRGLPQACLFVASLTTAKTDTQLHNSITKKLSEWGELLNVKVMRDWLGRPYSFVQFKAIEDAERALAEANGIAIEGRKIRIERARVNRTLYIAKLDPSITEAEVESTVREYGEIEDMKLLHDASTGEFKHCGYFKYRFREDAIEAYVEIPELT